MLTLTSALFVIEIKSNGVIADG